MKPMPKVIPQQPYYDDKPNGPRESLNDWFKNNTDSVQWFLENAEELRSLIEKKTEMSGLKDLRRDLEELALAFGRTGNFHVADQLNRMGKFLNENIEALTQ